MTPAVLKSGLSRERFPIGECRETVLGSIDSRAKKRFPFYFCLPNDDPIAMLRWRIYVRSRAATDKTFRKMIWDMARMDFAFFAVTFLSVFEPRPNPRILPFFLFKDQVSIAAWIDEIFGVRDGAVNKTRGIGISYLVLSYIYWKWTFEPAVKIAVLSADKDRLDTDDDNSTMGKLQLFHDNMPEWAKVTPGGRDILKRTKEEHFFQNLTNGALVQGFVSTGAKLKQLRFTWLFADEFAYIKKADQEEWMVSSAGTCNARLFVSTWGDFDDKFHEIVHEEDSSLLKMSAFWWNNEDRWQGCYTMQNGFPKFIDKDYIHPPDYQYGQPDMLEDGMLRSPWVDGELSRAGANKLKTLRDLYGMSVCQRSNSFFAEHVYKAAKESSCEPTLQGKLINREGVAVIEPTTKSDIRLWCNVPEVDRGPYTAFADLGGGAGLAYSVLCVLDRSGEQVCEYGSNTVDIVGFAANCVAVLRYITSKEGDGWAVLDYDTIGPLSKSYLNELLRLGYTNIWVNQIIDKRNRRAKIRKGELPQYYGTVNRDSGMANFGEYGRAVMEMETVPNSELIALDMWRCGKDHDRGGQPKFAKPTGGKGHGDFLYAAAGAWWRLRASVDVESRGGVSEENLVEWKERRKPRSKFRAKCWSDMYSKGNK